LQLADTIEDTKGIITMAERKRNE